MADSITYYLLESSVCLLLFLVVYRLLISNLTHFAWMRTYLLISVILSLVLPMVILPVQWSSSFHAPQLFNYTVFLKDTQYTGNIAGKSLVNGAGSNTHSLLQWVVLLLTSIYISGVLYKAFNFFRNLGSIQKCIRLNPKTREDGFWFVDLADDVPPFSFFNYIFIANSCQKLSPHELKLIKDHEKIHSRQLHSLDLLFIEFVSIVFWFNPLMIYLKKSIQELHEYIVDEKIAERGKAKKDYAELLLKLASEVKGFNLSAGFSGNQIRRRIVMIARPRSLPEYKVMFILLIPVTVLIMFSFSYIKNPDPVNAQPKQNEILNQGQLKIGKITWKGNTVYDTKTLNNVFGLKEGSVYDKALAEDRLNGTSGARNVVSDLYLDNGYLYSRVTFEAKQNNESVDLTITIYEGKRAKIGDVIFKVDGTVTKDPVDDIGIKRGELFSKAKIIKSIRILAASGKFDPEKINPSPIPHGTADEFDNVDLLFELTTINNKK
jgi:hypothetical protein